MSARPLVQIEDLSVSFGGVPAVQGLDLTVHEGQSVGLVGESGSGKTMTALSLLGLAPAASSVSARTLSFDGTDLQGLGTRELRRLRGVRMGYIPQDPLAALNPVLRVGDQITEVQRMHPEGGRRPRAVREILRGFGVGGRPKATTDRAAGMLEEVSIPDGAVRAGQFPFQFSGGMRQRAILASAVALSPSLIVADEPTTALDATVEKQVLELLEQLRHQKGTAMLLVTHDLNVVSWHCDYVYVLYGGRLLEQGPTEQLFSRPKQPYTAALMAASPDLKRPPRPRQRSGAVDRPDPSAPGCPFAPRCPQALPVCSERFPESQTAGPDHAFSCHNPL